ncbi:MAG: zf-HC2 domain-containing protein, partial [Alphaproteobacteria bacterium]|nr:zf-HC2 domain-containing protein [Alphaproteobacteria bacterium]
MADIDCPTCASLIDAYVDGELSADVAAAVEQALPHCPDCRRRLEEARILRDALGG